MRLKIVVSTGHSGQYTLMYFLTVVAGVAGISYEASQSAPFYVNMILVSISLVAMIFLKWRRAVKKMSAANRAGSRDEHAFASYFGIFAFLFVPWIQFIRGIALSYVFDYIITLLVSFAILAGVHRLLAAGFISGNSPNLRDGKSDESVRSDFANRYSEIAGNITKILFFEGPVKRGGAWVQGISRSVICIDQSFWKTLSLEERDALLLHEVGHMKARDYILSGSFSALLVFLNSLRFSGVIYFAIVIPILFGGSTTITFTVTGLVVLVLTAVAFLSISIIRKMAKDINTASQMRADDFAYEHLTGNKNAIISLFEKLRVYGSRNLDGQRMVLFDSILDERTDKMRDKP